DHRTERPRPGDRPRLGRHEGCRAAGCHGERARGRGKDEHNRRLRQVRGLGVPVGIADATLPQVLESVRLASASAVAGLTRGDLETGLALRDQLGPRWGRTPVVLRIFDPQLARSVKDSFGFHFVRSTAALAALWFVGAALGLDVLSTFYVADELLLVARLNVTP